MNNQISTKQKQYIYIYIHAPKLIQASSSDLSPGLKGLLGLVAPPAPHTSWPSQECWGPWTSQDSWTPTAGQGTVASEI